MKWEIGKTLSSRLNEFLQQAETVKRYRTHETAFTRIRKLTFERVVALIMAGHKVAAQSAVMIGVQSSGADESWMATGSAYLQARAKLKPELFIKLNQISCEAFYEDEPQKWLGHRLLGVDGTLLNLPDTPELRAVFSIQKNQRHSYVQGQSMVLHDLLNDIGVAATLGPLTSESDDVLRHEIWSATQVGDVIVMDRGIHSYILFATAIRDKRDIIARCYSAGFAVIQAFRKSKDTQAMVELQVPVDIATRVATLGLPSRICVRLEKFVLPSGEIEVLLTTLLDTLAYPREALFEAYGKRYPGQEGFFNRIKNVFDLERFSSKSEQFIRQDVHAVIFLATYESILSKPAQTIMDEQHAQSNNTTVPKVNHVTGYIALAHRVIQLLAIAHTDFSGVMAEITQLLLLNPTRHVPNRSAPRHKRAIHRSVRHLRYTKRLTG